MTYVFFDGTGDRRTVWSPVSRAGALYLGMLRVTAEVYDLPTGLTAMADDLHMISPEEFEQFVRELLSIYSNTNHAEILSFLRAVLAPSVVLLERCGRPVVPTNDEEQEIVQAGRELALPD